MSIELTIYTKPGCHLCEQAREAIDRVIGEFKKANKTSDILLEEINILDNAELEKKYAEEIPVLLINGNMHNYWRIDEERLMRALHRLATS